MLFISLSFWQFHVKIQNYYPFDETEKRVLFKQLIALLIVFFSLILKVGVIFNWTPLLNFSIWIWLISFSLVFIGISSIINKVTVIGLRSWRQPRGNWAVLLGLLSILVAIIISISYLRGVFGDF
jgi:hypothetical protein